MPRVTVHGLRHTSATLLLGAGEPVHVVASRLGHKDATITLGVYAHLCPATDGRRRRRWDACSTATGRPPPLLYIYGRHLALVPPFSPKLYSPSFIHVRGASRIYDPRP